MTKEQLIRESIKMERVIDLMLEILLSYIDTNEYQLLRYYFSQSDYDSMLKVLLGGNE